MNKSDILKARREELGMSYRELSEKTGYSKSVLQRYESGTTKKIPVDRLEVIAKALNLDIFSLYDFNEATQAIERRLNENLLKDSNFSTKTSSFSNINKNNSESNIDSVSEHIYNIPVYETVSAGFGATAVDNIIDYIPLPFNTKNEAEQTLCIKVKGDSMSPKIEDGDLIQVIKQTSVDSGNVAVVLIDNEEGLVKKVEYDNNYIKLISFNPYYPPIEFKGKDVLRVVVVGKVKRIIRDL